ncbi:MAG TPA: D-aminoacyl-tRNA deacylase [Gammaproteobacteria bacterium]|nr:D-aminoacyl-tRNA deacylase [Gammaproteobacteria bacterium]
MIGLLQRVTEARVEVGGEEIAAIGPGLLVLVGVERHDDPASADRLADRLVAYRVFADDSGRMNRSVRDVGGSMLLVPQFTLAADTTGGLRPSFSTAAPPDQGQALFDRVVAQVRASGVPYAVGRFGADMQVSLTNDGPVMFWLEA